MATSTTIYIINSTDNSNQFSIQPRTQDGGADGVQRSTDLVLYGNAAENWGEKFNENFYRLLENFACDESAPGVPQDEGDIGGPGFGINAPVAGQLWFNKTDEVLYVYNGTAWATTVAGGDISDITGLQAALDAKVDRAGDTQLTGVHQYGTHLFFNEGNGSIAAAPDIRFGAAGLLAADASIHINIDGDNSGGGNFVISKGALNTSDGNYTPLVTVQNDGTLHVEVANYENQVTNDDDVPNKKYVDDEIASEIAGLAIPVGFVTGDIRATLRSSADAGWVMLNDGTIGAAGSGASARANNDTEDLFTLIWNTISNAWAPVGGGRGASAAADFAAGKTIGLPRTLGRVLANMDTGNVLGEYEGAKTHALTASENGPHTHSGSGTTNTDGAHTHNIAPYDVLDDGGNTNQGQSDSNDANQTSTISSSGSSHSHAFSFNTNSSGSGTPHNIMQPTVFVHYQIKL